jgi:DNA-binding SARP family transcriptional activator
MLATVDGDIATAERLIDEGLASSALADDPDGPLVWGGQLGVIRWMQGRVDELEPLYRDMAATSSEPVWPAILAWLWARHGLREAARGMLERIADIGLDAVPRDRHWLLTMATIAEASARVGAVDIAAEVHAQLVPYNDRMVPIAMGVSYWGTVARPLALVELALGRPDVAIERFEAAVTSAARFGALPWMAEAQLDLAETSLEHGPTGAASQLIAESRATAQRLGLVELLQRADSLALRLEAARPEGVDPAPPGDAAVSEEGPSAAPRVRVLGGFACVDVDGNDVVWSSRKARAVLKLLVDARGARVPRDVLIERLWPGAEPSAVANRLAVAISTVRRSLDPRGVFPRSSFVGVDRDTVWLESANVDVDLERFLAAAATALGQGERSDESPEQVMHRLQSAVALHGGVAFADDPYDDWWIATREQVSSIFSEVCHKLAMTARDAGLDQSAAAALRAALDADPYDERAHRALVELHRERGAHGLADLAEERYRVAMDELAS